MHKFRSISFYILLGLILGVAVAGCRQGDSGEESPQVDSLQQERGGPPTEQPAEERPSDSYAPDSAKINRTWNEARQRGVDFRAAGNEPGWYLEVFAGDSLLLVADYGERRISTPVGRPVRTDSMRAWRAQDEAYNLSVIAEPLPCTDSMNGMRFPSTVTVILDGHTYRGCGRDL